MIIRGAASHPSTQPSPPSPGPDPAPPLVFSRGAGARVAVSRLPRGTPLGRRAGLIGIGLLFAGFNTGNNLFYLVFTVLAASELVGFHLAGRALRRLKAEVALPKRGRAGAPMRITIRLTNTSRRLPVPALVWGLRASGGELAEVRTAALSPGASGSGTGRLVPAGRGPLRVELAEARTEFPLGLARRAAKLVPLEAGTLVTPQLGPLRPASAGSRRGDVRQLAQPKGTGEEPLDAREYRPGDDARRIDWKASARCGELMWRDRRGEPPRAIRVSLERSGEEGPAFEERVSRAAASAVSALARGRAVCFVSDEWELLPRSGPAQRRRILDYLATVRPRISAARKGAAGGSGGGGGGWGLGTNGRSEEKRRRWGA